MHTALLLDISSGSVGAGIVGLEAGSLPSILFSRRRDFSSGETAMLSSLKSVLQDVFQNGVGVLREADFPNHFDHVLITLSPPWAETTLTSKYESGGDIFESTPLGSSFVTSSANKDLVRRIENEVIKTLGIKRGASIQSFSYAFSKVLAHFRDSKQEVLLARFTGFCTELVWMDGEEVGKLGALDFGPRSISLVLSEKLRLPLELAESMLSLFVRGELDRDSAVRIDELVTSLEDKWERQWSMLDEGKTREIMFISEPSDSALASTLFSSVNAGAQVVDLASEGFFLPHVARGQNSDVSLSVLASFSHMLV